MWRMSLGVGLLWAACGGGGGEGGGGNIVRGMVTPGEGGTLASADGRLTLTFPAGAVDAPLEVTIGEVSAGDAEELEPPVWRAGPAYELGPDGTTFAMPVEIALAATFEELALRDDGYDLRFFGVMSQAGDTREMLPGADGETRPLTEIDLEARTVVVRGRTTHFSTVWGADSAVLTQDIRPDIGSAIMDMSPREVVAYVGDSWSQVVRFGNVTTASGYIDHIRVGGSDCAIAGPQPVRGDQIDACTWDVSGDEFEPTDVPAGEESYLQPPLRLACHTPGMTAFFSTLSARFSTLGFDSGAVGSVRQRIECLARPVPPDPEPEPYCELARPSTKPVADLGVRFTPPEAPNPLCQAIELLVDDRPTKSSFASVPPEPRQLDIPFHFDFSSGGGFHFYFRSTRGGADAFSCGDGEAGKVLCSPGAVGGTLAGDHRIVFAGLRAEVELADPSSLMQYAFVFDSDGNAGNNYQADPRYPNDFFQGTDRWYVADYSPANGWQLKVTDARGGALAPVVSEARFVIDRNLIALIVPVNEVPGGVGGLEGRVTAFRHSGDYGENPPHDWDGDVEPPVDRGLRNFGAL